MNSQPCKPAPEKKTHPWRNYEAGYFTRRKAAKSEPDTRNRSKRK